MCLGFASRPQDSVHPQALPLLPAGASPPRRPRLLPPLGGSLWSGSWGRYGSCCPPSCARPTRAAPPQVLSAGRSRQPPAAAAAHECTPERGAWAPTNVLAWVCFAQTASALPWLAYSWTSVSAQALFKSSHQFEHARVAAVPLGVVTSSPSHRLLAAPGPGPLNPLPLTSAACPCAPRRGGDRTQLQQPSRPWCRLYYLAHASRGHHQSSGVSLCKADWRGPSAGQWGGSPGAAFLGRGSALGCAVGGACMHLHTIRCPSGRGNAYLCLSHSVLPASSPPTLCRPCLRPPERSSSRAAAAPPPWPAARPRSRPTRPPTWRCWRCWRRASRRPTCG